MVPEEVPTLLEDFDALASSLAAGLGDVRGCLVLSRDGMILGSNTAEAQARLTPAWVRFAALGDTERGFAQFGAESWCYVRRGPYAAFAIAGPGARPGLVLDQMDQVLLAAEEGRARHEGFGARVGEGTPTTRPRTHLHPEPHGKEPLVIDVPRSPAVAEASTDAPPQPGRDLGFGPFPQTFVTPSNDAGDAAGDHDDEPVRGEIGSLEARPERDVDLSAPEAGADADADAEAEPYFEAEAEAGAEAETDPGLGSAPQAEAGTGDPDGPAEDAPAPWEGGSEPWETGPEEHDDVDRFSLAREFGQLLQRGEDPADG
jgi:hypothetical protein